MPKIYVYGSRDKLENYANALEGSGLEGLFSLDISQAEECDGLLLPGGGDIDPARYGQLPAGSEAPDLQRDAAELELVSRFLAWGKPILGICRGVQLLNVALGGNLIQDLPTVSYHRRDPERGDRVHTVSAGEGTFLSSLYGREFAVNSAHHQALGRLAPDLNLAAVSVDDGVPEAGACPEKRIYGVQWRQPHLPVFPGPLPVIFRAEEKSILTFAALGAIISSVGYARVLELADRHV